MLTDLKLPKMCRKAIKHKQQQTNFNLLFISGLGLALSLSTCRCKEWLILRIHFVMSYETTMIWAGAWQNQHNHQCSQWRPRSARTSPSQIRFFAVHSEDFDQTGRMLCWAHRSFCWFCEFVMLWLIYYQHIITNQKCKYSDKKLTKGFNCWGYHSDLHGSGVNNNSMTRSRGIPNLSSLVALNEWKFLLCRWNWTNFEQN